ncbi:MAG: hypothetical protein PHD11_06900 [Bacteroidales bacterium]|nr:hypothetical protein [Bacteroidales bacterium]MDD4671046.1 hypothetical protein [Bacteroidales bacterium]
MEIITKKLNFTETLTDGVKSGIANFFPLFLTTLLYIITCWIPYLNVGTTVGFYRAILKISKGESVDPVAIFNKENFNQIGDVFLLLGLMSMGITIGLCFMILPAIVISIAWGYAIYILIDRKETPTKALTLSYKITLGEKWTIFFLNLVVVLCIGLIAWILSLIPAVGSILAFLASLVMAAIYIGVEASIYKRLSEKFIEEGEVKE